MISSFSCVACGNNAWQKIGSKIYKKESIDKLDSYNKVRFEVLFTLWMKGVDTVSLSVDLCKKCGFICYSPRPTADEISEKYDYIGKHVLSKDEFKSKLKSDLGRSIELYNEVCNYIPGSGGKILDFGGGKGRLLYEFLQNSHECHVVDLIDETNGGVNYLGSDLNNIHDKKSYFDLIICSHVLEHLSNPSATISALKPFLAQSGFIYVEVPLEIWKSIPPKLDPVTHINFFSENSLRALLQKAGCEVLECRMKSFIRPAGKIGVAIKAVSRMHPSETIRVDLKGCDSEMSLLNPTFLDRILRIMRHPKLLLNVFS